MGKNKEEVELSDGLGAFILEPSHTIVRGIITRSLPYFSVHDKN